MIVTPTNPQDKAGLVQFMARKLAMTPHELVGPVPFEIVGTVHRGRLMGAVLYTGFRGNSMEMACVGEPGWLTRGDLRDIFAYPFIQLSVMRVWSCVPRNNAASRELATRLGFRLVGVADNEFGPVDGIIYSLTKAKCRWITGVENGQGRTKAA